MIAKAVAKSVGAGVASAVTGESSGGEAVTRYGIFDGTDDYVVTPSLDLTGTSAVSISCWWNQVAYNTSSDLLFEFSTNAGSITTGFYFDPCHSSGSLSQTVKGDVGFTQARFTRPSQGVWKHIVAIFDKSQTGSAEVSLYIDAVGLTPTSTPLVSDNTNNFGNHALYIGSRGGTSLFNNMLMRDFRVYSDRLSGAEATYLLSDGASGSDPGSGNLVANYAFSDGSGTTITDSSGNGNHATATGMTWGTL